MTPDEIWQRYDDDEQRLTAGVSEFMLDLAGLTSGQVVLDVATGRGEPAIRAAMRVGASGKVVGIDVAESMLQMARTRANAQRVSNLELHVGNAQSFDLGESYFDVALARWGLMYMEEPVTALRCIYRGLKPNGKIVAAFWAEPERVEYFTLPRRELEKYKFVPKIELESPGTFRFSSSFQIERDFSKAGFRIQEIKEMRTPVMEAATSDGLIAWVRAFGLERLVSDLPQPLQSQWERDVILAAEEFREGPYVRLGGVTKIVVATR